MNIVAWGIIKGFIVGVAFLSVLGLFLLGFKNGKDAAIYCITVFILIMGALLIGKFFFPY